VPTVARHPGRIVIPIKAIKGAFEGANPSSLMSLMSLLTRDAYETTDAWSKRVDDASLVQEIRVVLGVYDPDAGRYPEAQFNGTVLDLRLPPAAARQLRDEAEVGLQGRVRIFDASHIELVGPQLVKRDGSRLPLTTPVTSCVTDLANMGPSMRAYSHPRLADLRARILTTRIDDILDKALAQGFTPEAALAATRKQAEVYAQEAQQVVNDIEPNARNDLDRAVGDKLAVGYNCDGAGGGQVCLFLERAWQAKASREVAKALECRI
jgi:hypothetical protein